MITNCEICMCEVEDTEVNWCYYCDRDGLCDECLNDHNCIGSDL